MKREDILKAISDTLPVNTVFNTASDRLMHFSNPHLHGQDCVLEDEHWRTEHSFLCEKTNETDFEMMAFETIGHLATLCFYRRTPQQR